MDDDDEFTFAVVPSSVFDGGGGVFCSGRVGTSYPVFGRPRSPPRPPEPETATVSAVPLARLLLVDVDKKPSPAQTPGDDDLDSVPADMYCPWSPGWSAASSPAAARCRKSSSTGSPVLRWRPRLVRRSQSDGKERFVFFNTSAASRSSHQLRRKGSTRRNGEATGAGSGHSWSYYAKGSRGGNNGARRTSFLPYKQNLVGLFANAAVFRRGYLPF